MRISPWRITENCKKVKQLQITLKAWTVSGRIRLTTRRIRTEHDTTQRRPLLTLPLAEPMRRRHPATSLATPPVSHTPFSLFTPFSTPFPPPFPFPPLLPTTPPTLHYVTGVHTRMYVTSVYTRMYVTSVHTSLVYWFID